MANDADRDKKRRESWVPEAEWYASLPGFTCSAGALITEPGERILIVKSWYRDAWTLPGGVVEAGESPRQCAEREVLEETGLPVTAGGLLAVQWVPPQGARRAIIAWLFDGGSVPDPDAVCIDPVELEDYAFLPVEEAVPLLVPRAARRVEAAWRARQDGGPAYLEGGG